MKPFSLFIFALLSYASAQGSVLILDSFAESPFTLSAESNNRIVHSTPITSDVTDNRAAGYNPRSFGFGTLVATVDSTQVFLSYRLNGTRQNITPIQFWISYRSDQPGSLLGYEGFEFVISNLQGKGFVTFALDGSASLMNETSRLEIKEGINFIPFENLSGTGASQEALSDFTFISVVFEAETEVLEFDLHEIRVVPEPSAALLTLLSVGVFAIRRRR